MGWGASHQHQPVPFVVPTEHPTRCLVDNPAGIPRYTGRARSRPTATHVGMTRRRSNDCVGVVPPPGSDLDVVTETHVPQIQKWVGMRYAMAREHHCPLLPRKSVPRIMRRPFVQLFQEPDVAGVHPYAALVHGCDETSCRNMHYSEWNTCLEGNWAAAHPLCCDGSHYSNDS
jgi:hypothetical protein